MKQLSFFYFQKAYGRASTVSKVFLFVCVITVLILIGRGQTKPNEGFGSPLFANKTGTEIYDGFYSQIYDLLVYNNLKNEYEVGQIVNKTQPSSKSILLDIGCGTGHHVAGFAAANIQAMGVDISKAMVAQAQKNYPSLKFFVKDAMTPSSFAPQSFTHITCLYFTLYYFKDKLQFFRNCHTWLKRNGYLIVHLVDRNQFDPVLPPGNPLLLVSPQKYAPKRITSTAVTFTDFTYKSEFNVNTADNTAVFREKFRSKPEGKTYRTNEHHLYMEKQSTILQYALQAGFTLRETINLSSVHYESQFIYILTSN